MTITASSPVILQILPALEQGGVERGTLEMASAITQAGGTALVMSAGGRLVPALERLGARHLALPGCGRKNPVSILRNAGTLARFIRQNKVALVHARSRAPAWVARLACRRTGTPFVTTWHGVHANNFPGKRHYNAVLASGDRVIAISQHIGQRLAQDYHVGPDRLRVIPRGADITQFSPEAVTGQRVHRLGEAWDVPAGVPVILMPGRLTEWKGQRFLLDALALVKNTTPRTPWVCVFAGSCPPGNAYGEALVTHARTLGLTEQVRFAGHCQDMPAAMALAALVVIPSLRPEPFGRVVVEAQAMCRPVIVTAHGAALETVQHGMTGLSIPPGDVQALADAVASILHATPQALSTMGDAARMTVLAHYTTHAMQQATLSVYDELLGTSLHKNQDALFQDTSIAG
nr:glycosyltransferase family 4 protein [uncultured Acetobacter sp.]